MGAQPPVWTIDPNARSVVNCSLMSPDPIWSGTLIDATATTRLYDDTIAAPDELSRAAAAAKTTFETVPVLVRRWERIVPTHGHGGAAIEVWASVRVEAGATPTMRLGWRAGGDDHVEPEFRIKTDGPGYAEVLLGTISLDGDGPLTVEGWAATKATGAALWWDALWLVPAGDRRLAAGTIAPVPLPDVPGSKRKGQTQQTTQPQAPPMPVTPPPLPRAPVKAAKAARPILGMSPVVAAVAAVVIVAGGITAGVTLTGGGGEPGPATTGTAAPPTEGTSPAQTDEPFGRAQVEYRPVGGDVLTFDLELNPLQEPRVSAPPGRFMVSWSSPLDPDRNWVTISIDDGLTAASVTSNGSTVTLGFNVFSLAGDIPDYFTTADECVVSFSVLIEGQAEGTFTCNGMQHKSIQPDADIVGSFSVTGAAGDPTVASVDPCSVLARDAVEAEIGPVAADPQRFETEFSADCSYISTDGSQGTRASVQVTVFEPGATHRLTNQQPVDGVGDEAVWGPLESGTGSGGQLVVTVGDGLYAISVYVPQPGREAQVKASAIRLARGALERGTMIAYGTTIGSS